MGSVLVTGAHGQSGNTLRELVQDYERFYFDFKGSEELDITSAEKIEATFAAAPYDFCVNCAAYTNVEQAEKTPEEAYAINADAVKKLAKACQKHKVTLVHISTDYVFDGSKASPYTTEDSTNPINEYGKSKLLGEEYVRTILPNNHYILRTSWLYSKKYGHNFYRTVLSKAKKGEELRITDEQLGCPTNTETLVRYILDEILSGNKNVGTYHVTDGVPMTWYDFAKSILEEESLLENVKLVLDRNYRTFAARPKNTVLI